MSGVSLGVGLLHARDGIWFPKDRYLTTQNAANSHVQSVLIKCLRHVTAIMKERLYAHSMAQ